MRHCPVGAVVLLGSDVLSLLHELIKRPNEQSRNQGHYFFHPVDFCYHKIEGMIL